MMKPRYPEHPRLDEDRMASSAGYLIFFEPMLALHVHLRQPRSHLPLVRNNRQGCVDPTKAVEKYTNHGHFPSNDDRYS